MGGLRSMHGEKMNLCKVQWENPKKRKHFERPSRSIAMTLKKSVLDWIN
jgi:hypothetical protein